MKSKSDVYKVALNRVASYCSKAERCEWDVRQRLNKFDLSESDKHEIISWLVKENFLDESRYCNAFVNDKVKFSRWGRLKIRQALIQKRVDEHLIDEVLRNMNLSLYMENLSDLIVKRKKEIKEDNTFILQSKLIKYAMGRGFTYSEIKQVLEDDGGILDFI
ncbi:MAG: RecX family transcriptional regulator [Bacteroidales bacterium]|nr:RecX family transcriptional regulator [Bacteroidales bacterium]